MLFLMKLVNILVEAKLWERELNANTISILEEPVDVINLKLNISSLKRPGIFVGDKLSFVLFVSPSPQFQHTEKFKEKDNELLYAFYLDSPVVLLHFCRVRVCVYTYKHLG